MLKFTPERVSPGGGGLKAKTLGRAGNADRLLARHRRSRNAAQLAVGDKTWHDEGWTQIK